MSSSVQLQVGSASWSFQQHIRNYQENGKPRMRTLIGGLEGADLFKAANWKPEQYAEDVGQAIIHGGFSFFREVGQAREEKYAEGILLKTEKTMTVAEREPILLPDETLQEVGVVKEQLGKSGQGRQLWGRMFFSSA